MLLCRPLHKIPHTEKIRSTNACEAGAQIKSSANICEKVAIHMQTTSQSQSQTNKRKKALNQNRIEPVNKSVT